MPTSPVLRSRRARLLAITVTVPLACVGLTAVQATARPTGGTGALARPDSYSVRDGSTLTVGRGHGVLANDKGDLTTVVRHTPTAHGTLNLNPDGTFSYTPDAGFRGTDTFTYGTTDAVHLYQTDIAPLATIGGVKITGSGYGSSFTADPNHKDVFYGLTDRGPNVDGPDGTKIEPLPDFTPAIGKFRLTGGHATLLKSIPLHAGDGQAYDGQVNCQAGTGETITDLDGTVLPCSDTGYDPEGLVALPDGTFWVSDEYGPFITHFSADGTQLGRLSPFDHSLPRELADRLPNRGMEGLTVTPDGRTLVGIMQSALQQPDYSKSPKNIAPVRIVTVDLKTGAEHEYLFLLDNPDDTSTAVSEITALSSTQFVVDERDGNFAPHAYKRLYKIDLSRATDVGPLAHVQGATYDAAKGGLLVGPDQQTIEALVGKDGTKDARAALAAVHIRTVSRSLDVNFGRLITSLDPSGDFFGHDKIEGVASLDRGRTLVISNDSDFGIDGITNDAPPFQLHAKLLPDGQQDDGEFLAVDTDRVGDPVTSTTVSILVR